MNAPKPPARRSVPDSQQLAGAIVRDPRRVVELMEGLDADAAETRFRCAKALRRVSEKRPDLLYPHFDFFVRLLDHPNKIFQWEGALVLAQLARVDTDDRFTAIFDKYFAPVAGPVMITAANVIRGSGRIARAKPQLADRIAGELLRVERARYQTPECRNIAVGHALLALGEFIDLLQDSAPVLRFVRKQSRNSRAATRKKAQRLLKRVATHASLPA